jgi:hypothetical protein
MAELDYSGIILFTQRGWFFFSLSEELSTLGKVPKSFAHCSLALLQRHLWMFMVHPYVQDLWITANGSPEAFIVKWNPLIPIHLFKNIDYVAIVACAAVGAMIYYSMTILWPGIIGTVYSTDVLTIGWQSSVVGGGVLLAKCSTALLCHISRKRNTKRSSRLVSPSLSSHLYRQSHKCTMPPSLFSESLPVLWSVSWITSLSPA